MLSGFDGGSWYLFKFITYVNSEKTQLSASCIIHWFKHHFLLFFCYCTLWNIWFIRNELWDKLNSKLDNTIFIAYLTRKWKSYQRKQHDGARAALLRKCVILPRTLRPKKKVHIADVTYNTIFFLFIQSCFVFVLQ